uniref:Uncharacterized protein n=1 Tax=Sinocyclocheilus anshuiensis TaxID=1608454 RepID=A0A671S2X6_9TELE
MESVIKMNQGDTKWDIRHKVWNYIEVKNLASFPRPVHNRIPNFKVSVRSTKATPVIEPLSYRTSLVQPQVSGLTGFYFRRHMCSWPNQANANVLTLTCVYLGPIMKMNHSRRKLTTFYGL